MVPYHACYYVICFLIFSTNTHFHLIFLIATRYSRVGLYQHLFNCAHSANTVLSMTSWRLSTNVCMRIGWEETFHIDCAGSACWSLSPGFLWKWLFPNTSHLTVSLLWMSASGPFIFRKPYFPVRILSSNCSPSSPPARLPWTDSWREDHSCYKWK